MKRLYQSNKTKDKSNASTEEMLDKKYIRANIMM